MHTIVATWNTLSKELVAFVNTKVKDQALAEDIVQDVFIKVYTRAHQIKEAEKITAWIYQITRHAVADYFRKHVRNVEAPVLSSENDYSEFNDCVAHCLNVLMATLPDKYRVPLQLAELEGLSQYEIAERLAISYSGARTRVQRARKLLKEKMDALYHIQTDCYGNILVCEDRVPCCCRREC